MMAKDKRRRRPLVMRTGYLYALEHLVADNFKKQTDEYVDDPWTVVFEKDEDAYVFQKRSFDKYSLFFFIRRDDYLQYDGD